MSIYAVTFDKIEELVRADRRISFMEQNAIFGLMDIYPRDFRKLEGLVKRLYGIEVGSGSP